MGHKRMTLEDILSFEEREQHRRSGISAETNTHKLPLSLEEPKYKQQNDDLVTKGELDKISYSSTGNQENNEQRDKLYVNTVTSVGQTASDYDEEEQSLQPSTANYQKGRRESVWLSQLDRLLKETSDEWISRVTRKEGVQEATMNVKNGNQQQQQQQQDLSVGWEHWKNGDERQEISAQKDFSFLGEWREMTKGNNICDSSNRFIMSSTTSKCDYSNCKPLTESSCRDICSDNINSECGIKGNWSNADILSRGDVTSYCDRTKLNLNNFTGIDSKDRCQYESTATSIDDCLKKLTGLQFGINKQTGKNYSDYDSIGKDENKDSKVSSICNCHPDKSTSCLSKEIKELDRASRLKKAVDEMCVDWESRAAKTFQIDRMRINTYAHLPLFSRHSEDLLLPSPAMSNPGAFSLQSMHRIVTAPGHGERSANELIGYRQHSPPLLSYSQEKKELDV